ncbi:MAG: DUF6370 family protein [Planctomycetota bacterium]|nr:DUF6370 family protein [Planctomycetota bacterium]
MNKPPVLFSSFQGLVASLLVFLMTGCVKDDASTTNPTQGSVVAQPGSIDAEVEISCGECNFGMEGEGCTLAVRIDGKGYYVEGSSIDDHGDAHAEDGLCNCIRKARVVGKMDNGKFNAKSIKVLSVVKK